jgi:putative hydrolase of the HAD superfamily
VRETLPVLGISPSIFELIATSEITGTNKPDPAAFEFILSRTGLPAGAHLMVGDREDVDIEPAKSVGMHTCLVWGKGRISEYSLPSVYDVPLILE